MELFEKIRKAKGVVRAVIYARYSSDNQRSESVDAQIRAIKAYAKQHSIEIIEVYVDEARTATTDNRPNFLRMIKDAAKEDFDLVLVPYQVRK
jgi:site-specific DNA recombinase